MKTKLAYLSLALISAVTFSCKDQIDDIYTVNSPVYLTYDDLRVPLKVAEGQDIVQPGKIYFKDNFIFVNEFQKGIHVIDNSDPAAPEITKFIEIPGNIDMAIRDNILYADSYVDLVAIDISNLDDIKEISRINDAFPYMVPECGEGVIDYVDPTKGVVTGWKVSEKTVSVEHNVLLYPYYPEYDGAFYKADGLSSNGGGGSATGTGGSMARFTVYDNFLYTIDKYML